MIWNIILADKLPVAYQSEIFWTDIPIWLTYGENITRGLIFLLTFVMPLNIITTKQKRGLLIYLFGVFVYFSCWLPLIYFPDSSWSCSFWGFNAPAYTPLIWLVGIGLVGETFIFNVPYRSRFFILTSLLFLLFHNIHASMVFYRIN